MLIVSNLFLGGVGFSAGVIHRAMNLTLDDREELFFIDWMEEVRFGSDALRERLGVRILIGCRNKNDGDVFRLGVGLEAPANFEAIEVGEIDVEQYDIRLLSRKSECFGAAMRRNDVGSHGLQGFGERIIVRFVIVYDQQCEAIQHR
jgi:hypothetical protein